MTYHTPSDTPWCDCGTARGRQDGWTNRGDGVWVCARPGCLRPSRRNHERLAQLTALAERVIESSEGVRE